jgi:transposase
MLMARYELSDAQWARLAYFLPHPAHWAGAGHPWHPHRPLVNGILWHLHTGAPWRDVPTCYGPWQTVYDRFNWWRKDGTWARILTTLLDQLDDAGRISRDLWCIDASIIRASRAAAGARRASPQVRQLGGSKAMQLQEPEDHALGRSRGGFGTKVHLVCDSHGIVLAVFVTPGQRHESTAFETVMARVALTPRKGRRKWPKQLAGDKGYSYPRIRCWLQQHGIRGVIPTRENQPREEGFDRETYRQRNVIERAVNWYKDCRALGTRFDKLAVDYVALWLVAIIERLLRLKL